MAIATWESKAARDAATKTLGLAGQVADNPDSLVHRHLQFADVAPLLGLDEVDAVDPTPKPLGPTRA